MKAKSYDHLDISGRYFFAEAGHALQSQDHDHSIFIDQEFDNQKYAINIYWHRPFLDAPTLLYFHGNGERIIHQLDHWPEWTDALGINILFVDYPAYGASGGSSSLSSAALAARSAFSYLAKESEQPIFVGGRSVGSIFALDAAYWAFQNNSSNRLKGLFLESAVSDVVERLAMRVPYEALGVNRQHIETDIAKDYNQEEKIKALSIPILILHTINDSLVDIEHGKRLAKWAGNHLFEKRFFEAGDHNTIQWINEKAYREGLKRFVKHCV